MAEGDFYDELCSLWKQVRALQEDVMLLKRERKVTSVSLLPSAEESSWKVMARRRGADAGMNKEPQSLSTSNTFSALENKCG